MKILWAALLLSTKLAASTSFLGRQQIEYPNLGYPSGAGQVSLLQGAIADLSDANAGRYLVGSAVADSTLTTYDHDFGVAFSELKVLLYTGTYPNLTRVADPSGAGWTIAANGTNPKIQIDVTTPSSGGPHDYVVAIVAAPILESPMTTRGDIIFQNASGEPERLGAAGQDNRVLRSNNLDVFYGQIDDPAFFTDGAAAGASASGIVTQGAQTFSGAKTFAGVADFEGLMSVNTDIDGGIGQVIYHNGDSDWGVALKLESGDGAGNDTDSTTLQFRKRDQVGSTIDKYWGIGIEDGDALGGFVISEDHDTTGFGTDRFKINAGGKVELSAREDNNCGLGNVCAGTNSGPDSPSASSNCTGGVTITRMHWHRVGNVVTGGFKIVCTTVSAGGFDVRIDPAIASTFTNTGNAAGTFRCDTGAFGGFMGHIEAETSAHHLRLITTAATGVLPNPECWGHFSYEVL